VPTQVQRPLYWHQGLFLQPQHFQLADAYSSSLLEPLRTYGLQHFWGTGALEIQETALGNKQFVIISGEFVFPDSTHVVFPGNAVLASRSFDEAWVEAERPFSVYLGLRRWDQEGGNVTVLQGSAGAESISTRFSTTTDPDEVKDLHASGPAANVKRLSFALRIFWETEIEQIADYCLIPIAQLERDGEQIKLSRRFIPPSLSISASGQLVQMIKDIRDQVSSRCRQLEEYKSPREIQMMELDIGYMVFLLALRTLNRHVPMLYHLTEAGSIHPWAVYGMLRQLIGELSTFAEGLSANGEREDGTRVLPLYDHENLWTCFSTAQNLIGHILDNITVGPGHIVRLEFDGKYFSAEMPEYVADNRNTYWLVVRTEADSKRVIEEVRDLAKLSASRNLTTLIARALPGIPLEYHSAPPPGLPRRSHSFHFRIDHMSEQWADIQKSQHLALYWDTAPNDVTADIVTMRR